MTVDIIPTWKQVTPQLQAEVLKLREGLQKMATIVFPGGGVYHATKHAVEALSDALRFEVKGFGIDVSIIEPGLIVTEFGETAAGSLNEVEDHGPYAKFNGHVAKLTAEAYQGPMAKFGGPPDKVAAKIEKALTARNPDTRYKVTASAGVIMGRRAMATTGRIAPASVAASRSPACAPRS